MCKNPRFRIFAIFRHYNLSNLAATKQVRTNKDNNIYKIFCNEKLDQGNYRMWAIFWTNLIVGLILNIKKGL
jgi:hypothetical protein